MHWQCMSNLKMDMGDTSKLDNFIVNVCKSRKIGLQSKIEK